ncbi:MAG: VTT domain-containing protein [Deltaproteobacteria bacterium]|nr:VTT domain-containing protein [Deltaproteobacteria bacterium]
MSEAAPATEQAPTEETNDDYTVDARLIRKSIVGLIVILAVAGLTGVLFKEPLQAIGAAFIDNFGLAGLFVGVIITDASPLPLTNEPLVFLARGAGLDVWTIFGVVSAASVVAGAFGYWSGRIFGGMLGLEEWLNTKQPALAHYMRRYGAEGVAIAALLPIPFALSTWSAGILHVPFLKVMVAALVRIPKTAFYVLLIVGGLSLGGA